MKSILRKIALAFVLMISVLALWQLIVLIWNPPIWLFPGPKAVMDRAVQLINQTALQQHLRVTVIEITMGYLIGSLAGMICGYPISQIRLAEKIITPYLIAANSIPVVAFAPLLLLWFGPGVETKIAVAAIMVFFPVTISTLTGFHQQSRLHLRLMDSLRASKWQKFWIIELPTATPGLIAGLKIGAPLAVVGAVVGEFLGTGEGLGHLILEANGTLDTPQLFVAIIALAITGIVFYGLVLILERVVTGPWHHKRRGL